MRILPALVAVLISLPLLAADSDGSGSVLCHKWDCGGEYMAPEGSICEGWKFRIEPDMQMTDEDFTVDRARRALENLDEYLTKRGGFARDVRYGNLTILRGYVLQLDVKRAGTGPGRLSKEQAVERYCTWLRDEGYFRD